MILGSLFHTKEDFGMIFLALLKKNGKATRHCYIKKLTFITYFQLGYKSILLWNNQMTMCKSLQESFSGKMFITGFDRSIILAHTLQNYKITYIYYQKTT